MRKLLVGYWGALGLWLGRRLCRWLGLTLPGADAKPSRVFDAVVDGRMQRVTAVRREGVALLCRMPGGVRIVYDTAANDAVEYWGAWRACGGPDLQWEDGDKFEPPA